MIAAVLLLLAVHPDADRAIALVQAQRHAEALEALADEPDPLRRVQTEVWVLHQSGDLEGALAAALRALDSAPPPEDAWLLEQAAWIAVTLHRGPLARRLAERRLALLEASGAPPETLAAARSLLREARTLEQSDRAASQAVRRAQRTSLALLAALLLALLTPAALRRNS